MNRKTTTVNFDVYRSPKPGPAPHDRGGADHIAGPERFVANNRRTSSMIAAAPTTSLPERSSPASQRSSASERSSSTSTPPPAASPFLAGQQIIAIPGQRHHPRRTAYLGPVIFHRCRCGLLIVENAGTRALFWIPVKGGVNKIETLEQLRHVLGTDCWEQRRLEAEAAESTRRATSCAAAVVEN